MDDATLLERWRQETNFEERNKILAALTERSLFPKMREDNEDYGFYPDIDDPDFVSKLLKKREFAEHKQPSIQELIEEGDNPCDPTKEFEISPVQRFIGQYMSPKTPYNSALLYHGVGTGKTCAAITVAEAYLEMFPRKKVIIVAPPNIQPGFDRALFSEDRLVVGHNENEPNRFNGCTGNTYLRLSGMEMSRDPKLVTSRIQRLKGKRYNFFGYTQFYNHIRSILDQGVPKKVQGERRLQLENAILNKKFSGRLLIIDEAHNLRDINESEDDNLDAPGGMAELTEAAAGKRLTPFLKRLMDSADGMKLLLLTATPMYNSYIEIVFLFNLLLQNDKKATLKVDDIFNRNGTFKEGGEAILGRVASVYLSFMRGENPLSFPIRLEPLGLPSVAAWPSQSPSGSIVSEDDKARMRNLPFVACPFVGEALVRYRDLAQTTIEEKGLGLATVDTLIQAGNWMFPGGTIGEGGFSDAFAEESRGSLKVYRARDPLWLKEETIAAHSPKAALLLKQLKTTKGVSFVYSRFVKSGALSIALALEANGYTLYGRETPFLLNGNQQAEGRQCSQCRLRERTHVQADHPFSPAFYVLLTGRDEYSPNNKLSVDTARSDANLKGNKVKVILGSQVASEGIDLRFIRETFVFDSWYHMNKLEQVIGRSIRMCSHILLPLEERNCTINLLVTTLPLEDNQETLDLYQYRMGVLKALQVGRVTRILKRYALDCNLNRQAILIQGLEPRRQLDGQGQVREAVNINDMPFTSICDWIETCDYSCAKPVDINLEDTDDSTYDAYSARWRVSQLKERLRLRFEDQPFLSFENLQNLMSDVPRFALASILMEVVGNRSFRVRSGNQEGYIIYKNGFYLFQPEGLQDLLLPISLRVASFPVKRDSYEPIVVERERPAVAVAAPIATAAAAATATATATANNTEGTIEGFEIFWQVFQGWAESIQEGSATLVIPNTVKNAVKRRYGSNKKEVERVMNSFEMIPWLYTFLREMPKERSALGKSMCELVWDEYLKEKEQYALFKSAIENDDIFIIEVSEEHQVQSGASLGYRSLNSKTGILEYVCDGKPCNPALTKVFEEDDSDPLKDIKANNEVSSPLYGTVVYKRGSFVFKTNKPVSRDKKHPDKGSECAIVSTISAHRKTLAEIGDMARVAVGTDFDLNKVNLEDRRPFKNSARFCSLTDLVLRMLHDLDTHDKRWFYRPIAAFKSGHKGEKSA